ncbi:MAG TPA: rhomboid family intramembrane serine protease [Bacteroidetes bacterium]|nr:rhomboid family intramembrane serine protease [Bacteroidota bacterium]
MREIGTLTNEKDARELSDYLYVKGIDNRINEENGEWTIWVLSEDKIKEANKLLTRFQQDPNLIQDDELSRQAAKLREKEKQENTTYQKMMAVSRIKFRTSTTISRLTLILIIISIGVTLITGLGANINIVKYFSITGYEMTGGYIRWMPGLPEILHGQIWRLITPIFIHFGLLHILFNMLWLKDLGTMVENRHGIKMYAVLVFSIAILSNLGQYFVGGPSFGGMSGVVYGLLGYIWIRGKYDPLSGFYLENWIVIMMIGWFLLGFTGMIGHIANAAHGAGLAAGMAWGYLLAKQRPHFRKK